jgi:heme b synthase
MVISGRKIPLATFRTRKLLHKMDEVGTVLTARLSLVAWEITRSCNLKCAHCRASAGSSRDQSEMSTDECYRLIDSIVEIGKPILILTGGEPLARPDVFDIAKYGVSRGLRVVMGSNGTLISDGVAAKLKSTQISRIAISLDFPTSCMQDEFRGQTGSFDAALGGIAAVRRAGLELQINCTITRLNIEYIDDLLSLALELGASAFHPFFLVPTGRGKGLESVELSAEEYEKALNWIYEKQLELGDRIFFKPTDAPHYMRVMRQRQKRGNEAETTAAATAMQSGHNPVRAMTRGCLAGTGFCFISHTGKAQGCGYLEVEAGNLRTHSFGDIWLNSPIFRALRSLSNLKGKCGACEYKIICGGCRARAYEATGDFLESEPYCLHQPSACSRM